MNRIISEQYGLFRLYQRLRQHLMATLTEADLAFTPGGTNPSLGYLCVEIGETQWSYIDSFRTFTQTFDYQHADRSLEGSIAGLSAWYDDLDAELYTTIEALSDDDIANRPIDRGNGFMVPANIQLEIYKEALIVFYGKVTVYLKLLGKMPSEQWRHWMG